MGGNWGGDFLSGITAGTQIYHSGPNSRHTALSIVFLARKLPHKIEAGSVHTSSGAASSKSTPSFPSHILWSEDDSAAAMFSPNAWKSCCCCYMKNNFTFLASVLRLLEMAAGHLNFSSLNNVVNVWGSTRQCWWVRTGLTERWTL